VLAFPIAGGSGPVTVANPQRMIRFAARIASANTFTRRRISGKDSRTLSLSSGR